MHRLGRDGVADGRATALLWAAGEPGPFGLRLAFVLERAGHRLRARDQARKSGSSYPHDYPESFGAYRDRKVKKRSFRALWIQRINAAVRAEGLTYGQFMHGLKLAGNDLDRKVLADIAMHEGAAFSAIIAQAKAALPKEDAKAA